MDGWSGGVCCPEKRLKYAAPGVKAAGDPTVKSRIGRAVAVLGARRGAIGGCMWLRSLMLLTSAALFGIPVWGADPGEVDSGAVGVPAWDAPSEEVAASDPQSSDDSPAPDRAKQPALKFQGVVDSVLHFEELREKEAEWKLSTTRGTARVFGTLNDWLGFKVGVVGRVPIGTKDVDYVPFMPRRVREEFIPDDPVTGRPGTGSYLVASVEGDFYLQEAYADLDFHRVYFRLGRQKIETGIGYSYAPTDLLNRKNPLDPTFEIDGFDAAKMGIRISPRAEFSALVVTKDMPTYLGRFESTGQEWKAALQFTSVSRRRVNWNYINTDAGLDWLNQGGAVWDFERNFRWNQVSGEFRKNLRGTQVYGEAGWVFIEDLPGNSIPIPEEFVADHERFLVGIDRTFESQIRILFEYMRQGDGRASAIPIDLNDMMAFNFGETLSADRDNLFSECFFPLKKQVQFTVKTLAVLNHAAVFVNPWFHFDLHPQVRLSASVYKFFGTEGSSYEDIGIGAYTQLKLMF